MRDIVSSIEAKEFGNNAAKSFQEREAAKQAKILAERTSFYNNRDILLHERELDDRFHGNTIRNIKNDCMGDALKAIYITALEAETLTDENLTLAESMVDNYIKEAGGADNIIRRNKNKTYLLNKICTLVEDAAEEEQEEMDSVDTDEIETEIKKLDTDAGEETDEETSEVDLDDATKDLADPDFDEKDEEELEKSEDSKEDNLESSEDEKKSEDDNMDASSGDEEEDDILDDASEEMDKEEEERDKEYEAKEKARDEEESKEEKEEDDESDDNNNQDSDGNSDDTSDSSSESNDSDSSSDTEDSGDNGGDNSESGDEEENKDDEEEVETFDLDADDEDSSNDSDDPDDYLDKGDEENSEEENDSEESEEKDDEDTDSDDTELNDDGTDDFDNDEDTELGDIDDDAESIDSDHDEPNSMIGDEPDSLSKGKSKMFEELEDEEDVRKAIDIIKNRVADAEEAFIKRNAEDKRKIDNLLGKISDNVKKVEDLSDNDSDKAKVANEAVSLAKHDYDTIMENKELTVYESFVRNLTSSILANKEVVNDYLTESGKVDMPNIEQAARVMYTFLETLNTLQLEDVNSSYIEKILNEMK